MYGIRYLNDTEKNYSIGDLELLAVMWGLGKFRFYFYGKNVFLYTDHQALEPLIKRNRCNKQTTTKNAKKTVYPTGIKILPKRP